MFDALKPLLDSGIVNEETKNEIQSAWESKLNETREEIRGELRDEFSRRYEHDKNTIKFLKSSVRSLENLRSLSSLILFEAICKKFEIIKSNEYSIISIFDKFSLFLCKTFVSLRTL